MAGPRRAPASLPARLAAAAALLFLLAIHLTAVVELSTRGVVTDEAEHLHVGVKMARGELLFRTFAEHHPPFFFALLSHLVCADTHRYVVRARTVTAVAATLALGTMAWLVWRASGRRLYAPCLFVAVFLTCPPAWRFMTEVRVEPIALLLWVAGSALVLTVSGGSVPAALLRGAGLGLVFHASLWNPKWPVTSTVIGVAFLAIVVRDWRRGNRRASAAAMLTAIVVSLLGIAALAMLTDIRWYVSRVLALTLAVAHATYAWAGKALMPPFFYCPSLLRPRTVVPAAIAVALAAWAFRKTHREWRLALLLAALSFAALADLRILPSWPIIWPYYYAIWATMAAAMLALVPQAVVATIERFTPNMPALRDAFPVVITAVALVSATNVIPPRWRGPDPWWLSEAWLEQHVGPGDTVFLDVPRIPLHGVDASYYWFGFREFVPATLKYAATPAGARALPHIREEDLPPCRLEAGLEPHLRLIAGPYFYERLPVVAECFRRLVAHRTVTPSPVPGVYIVQRP